MSFVHGSSTRVIVNNAEVSTELSGWNLGWNRQMSDVTTIGQTAGAAGSYFVPGLQSGTLGLRGPQDANSLAGLTAKIKAAIGVDNSFLVTCFPDGTGIGKPAMFMVGDPTDYAVDASVSDATAMTFSAQADESVEMGYVIAPLQAYTADALTGTAVDRGPSPLTPTTRGLAAAVHVTAFSGFTGVAVKVQHSPDNVAWADLVSFTNITAVGSERVSVPIGTTVERYLRSSVDVTGTGSASLLVVAAPR